MAGNEEVLLQFKADDQVSSVVSSIQANTLNSINSIQQAMSQLNAGLGNMAGSANTTGEAFGNSGFQGAPAILSETAGSAEGASSSLNDVSESASDASKSQEDLSSSSSSVSSEMGDVSQSGSEVADTMSDVSSSSKDAGSGVEDLSQSMGQNTKETKDNVGATKEDKEAKQGLGNESKNTTVSTEELNEAIRNNTNLSTLSAGSAMYLAGQMSSLGTRMEDSAHNLNETQIGLGQVAKMSGMAEGEMSDMIATISNETFPTDEAILYTKNLVQMGVESKNFAEQATNIDRINDAFGLGAETSNSLATELSVLGVDANHLEDSFNALAYANENTKGGMQNYFAFLRKYDSELGELGYDVDQTAIIISAATQKYGGGRAALAGLSEALKDAGSDAHALEDALGLKTGALEHAKQETGSYEGQLQNLANEEMEHKTWLDRINAAWDDFTLKNSAIITTGQSILGVFGQTANIGLTIFGLKEMTLAFANFGGANKILGGTIDRMKQLRGLASAKEMEKVATAFPNASVSRKMTPVDIGGMKAPTTVPAGVGKNAGKVASETSQVVKAGGTVSAMAPEAGAVATGVEATGGAMAGISSAFTTLIVPLIAIAGVIAVMLPIIAGLVVEALLLIKGVQLVIKALNFDEIDLSGAIEGIKQVGEAIWEVARAMGAMALANILTIVATFTGGVIGLINPLGIATYYLLSASNELQKFSSVRIDKSIPDNIKNIARSLDLISNAFINLTKINILAMGSSILGLLTKNLNFMTGDISDVVKQLIDASHQIQKIKNIPDLDKTAINKLKKVSDGIKAMADAFDGLRKIRDGYNWDELAGAILNPDFFKDIPTRFSQVKQDIVNASMALKNFDNVADIPDGVGDKLKKVADALKSVGDSIETLRKLRDDYNWDGLMSIFGGANIVESLRSVKDDIWKVAGELRTMNGMPAIPKGVTKKLKNTSSALKSVLKSIKTMKEVDKLATGENNDFSSAVTAIQNARTAIYNVSGHLRALNGISAIKKGTDVKIKKVTKTLKNVVNAIKKMNEINGVSLNSDNLVKTFRDARVTIGTISKGLASYKNIANIPSGVADKVKAVKDTSKSVVDIIKQLNEINGTSLNPTDLVETFRDARVTIGTISKGLASYKNIANIPDNVATKVTKVRKTASRVVKAIDTLNGLRADSFNGDELVTTFQNARSSIGKISVSLKSYRNIANVPDNVGSKIKKVGSTSKKVATAIDGINTVPYTTPDAENIKNAVKKVRKTITQLNKLKGKKVGNISGILNKVKTAIKNLKKALNESGDFKSVGGSIGKDLSGGIKTGLGGLSGAVTTAVANAMRQGGLSALTGGMTMGVTAVTGFKTSFLLSSVIATEMNNALVAITNATPDLTNAMGQLAQQMVDEFKSKAEIASPGAIARSVRDEMGYMKGFVINNGKSVINSVGNLATSMVNTFNPNLQSSMDNQFNTGRLDSMMNLNGGSVPSSNNNRGNVTININEGAIQLDARNMTTQESRQILINAIEGLDVVKGIDVRGV